MKLTAISAFLALLAAVPAVANNVLSVSDASMTPTAIMPQSAETDTRKMLENWYLQNYTVLDTEADSRESAELTDEIIMDRLSRLPVSIEMPFNSVVGNSIRFYAKRRQLVENMLGLSIYYMPIFEEALERHGLPRELRYLPVIESALVPTAKSRAGAGGLWQFMPATGAGLGLEQNSLVDMRFDPYKSSEAAAIYLKQLYSTYNDWSLAIAAYNCGPGNVNKALARAGSERRNFWAVYDHLPRETRGYVPAFIGATYAYAYHRLHDIECSRPPIPLATDTVRVDRLLHFGQVASTIDVPVETLRQLNPQYKLDIVPATARAYTLVLPQRNVVQFIERLDSIHAKDSLYLKEYIDPANIDKKRQERGGTVYIVKKGDTLGAIARRYRVTTAQLMRWNGIKNAHKLSLGQRIRIEGR